MVAEIQAVLGNEAANSYLTLAEAEALMLERNDVSAWGAKSDDQKNRLLIQATSMIDTLMISGRNFFNTSLYQQLLRFPVVETAVDFWLTNQGTADSGSTTTLVHSALESTTLYRDDIFNGGSVLITLGAGQWQHMTVDDFELSSGALTFTEQSTAIDATSRYALIGPLPRAFKQAVAEQSLHLSNTGSLQRAQMVADGVVEHRAGNSSISLGTPETAASHPNLFSIVALEFLKPYIATSVQRV